jgi:hypothetical protein
MLRSLGYAVFFAAAISSQALAQKRILILPFASSRAGSEARSRADAELEQRLRLPLIEAALDQGYDPEPEKGGGALVVPKRCPDVCAAVLAKRYKAQFALAGELESDEKGHSVSWRLVWTASRQAVRPWKAGPEQSLKDLEKENAKRASEMLKDLDSLQRDLKRIQAPPEQAPPPVGTRDRVPPPPPPQPVATGKLTLFAEGSEAFSDVAVEAPAGALPAWRVVCPQQVSAGRSCAIIDIPPGKVVVTFRTRLKEVRWSLDVADATSQRLMTPAGRVEILPDEDVALYSVQLKRSGGPLGSCVPSGFPRTCSLEGLVAGSADVEVGGREIGSGLLGEDDTKVLIQAQRSGGKIIGGIAGGLFFIALGAGSGYLARQSDSTGWKVTGWTGAGLLSLGGIGLFAAGMEATPSASFSTSPQVALAPAAGGAQAIVAGRF